MLIPLTTMIDGSKTMKIASITNANVNVKPPRLLNAMKSA